MIVAAKLPGTSLESELVNVATVPPTAVPARPKNVLPPVAAIGKLVTPLGEKLENIENVCESPSRSRCRPEST